MKNEIAEEAEQIANKEVEAIKSSLEYSCDDLIKNLGNSQILVNCEDSPANVHKDTNKNQGVIKSDRMLEDNTNDLLLQNKKLQAQVSLLNVELESWAGRYKSLERENTLLSAELEQLRNNALDREYENGFFIEEEVFKKIENENCRLRKRCDSLYGDIVRVWFKMVEDEIKTKNSIE
ncbi:hypothetical protein PAEPH01_1053 [Pancytospora epiphaga]|nr:hypothetical protein PAEPH01_1053 [Pancytospora epiphaga]